MAQIGVWYCPTTVAPVCRLQRSGGQRGCATRLWAVRRKAYVGWSSSALVIAAFVVVGALFVVVALASSWLLSPKKPSPEKAETYECGVEPIGGPVGAVPHRLLRLRAALRRSSTSRPSSSIPWAVAFGALGLFVLVEMVVFVAILAVGLAYAWKEGALSVALDRLTGENSVLFIRSEQLFDMARAQQSLWYLAFGIACCAIEGLMQRRRPAVRLRPLRHLLPRLARGRPT